MIATVAPADDDDEEEEEVEPDKPSELELAPWLGAGRVTGGRVTGPSTSPEPEPEPEPEPDCSSVVVSTTTKGKRVLGH